MERDRRSPLVPRLALEIQSWIFEASRGCQGESTERNRKRERRAREEQSSAAASRMAPRRNNNEEAPAASRATPPVSTRARGTTGASALGSRVLIRERKQKRARERSKQGDFFSLRCPVAPRRHPPPPPQGAKTLRKRKKTPSPFLFPPQKNNTWNRRRRLQRRGPPPPPGVHARLFERQIDIACCG